METNYQAGAKTLNKEIWKPVFDGYYTVSDAGRVQRLISDCGTHSGRLLKQGKDQDGYHRFTARTKCKKITCRTHRIVAHAFLGPRPEGYQINHKNGIKTDNRIENLEYVTPKQNTLHAIKIGLRNAIGEGHGSSKLTNSDVLEIRRLHQDGISGRTISKKFPVGKSAVGYILSGKTWRHI